MKILCISNCNILGLKGTLNYLFKDSVIEDYLIQRFHENSEIIKEKINEFQLVIAPTNILNEIKDWSKDPEFIAFNPIIFHAFHPDQCYLFSNDKPLKGVLGDYHSLSAFSAYKKGYSVSDTERLMNEILNTPGLLEVCWKRSIEGFQNAQSDIYSDLIYLLRQSLAYEPFMHTLNHPKVYVIYLALQLKLLNKKLIRNISYKLPINDSLGNSVVWSIEKEVADNYKFKNYDHTYKLSEQNQFINRYEMIEKSFETYKNIDIDNLEIRGNLIFDKLEKIFIR